MKADLSGFREMVAPIWCLHNKILKSGVLDAGNKLLEFMLPYIVGQIHIGQRKFGSI